MELENIAAVEIPSTYLFCCDLTDASGSQIREKVTFTRLSTEAIPNSRGFAHLVISFVPKHPCTLTIQEEKKPLCITSGDSGNFVRLASFECRGLEPVRFYLGEGFRITSTGGSVYENVDLSEGEWCDYCEKAKMPLMISNIRAKFD